MPVECEGVTKRNDKLVGLARLVGLPSTDLCFRRRPYAFFLIRRVIQTRITAPTNDTTMELIIPPPDMR